MDIWIGTSGYSYPDWVGDFYPAGTRSNKMLAYYCRFFPLVELNFTFYRPPTREMLARLGDNAPSGFQFLVKLPRSLSHEQSRKDLPAFRLAIKELQQRKQLMGLLCQLPQSTHFERKTQNWLETLGSELADFRPTIEFRHRSWWRDDLADWMATHHLDLVAVDVPDLPRLFPRGWVQSSRRAYIRLHSRNAENWYGADKERYNYSYNDEELLEWVESLTTAARERTEEALFLFNNCYRGQAIRNANRMRELIAERHPHGHLLPPFAARPPEQRSLFE
jgi:uncharacterized protein YecE (DUF72 family)